MREARYVSLIPRTTLHSDSEQFVLPGGEWGGVFVYFGLLHMLCVLRASLYGILLDGGGEGVGALGRGIRLQLLPMQFPTHLEETIFRWGCWFTTNWAMLRVTWPAVHPSSFSGMVKA